MRNHGITHHFRSMNRLLLVLSIAIMISVAVPAHAEPGGDDSAFLSSLKQAGITYQNPDQAVAAGKAVCGLMSSGQSGTEVVHNLQTSNPGFRTDAATKFAAIAANAYCPDQLVTGTEGGPPRPRIDLDK